MATWEMGFDMDLETTKAPWDWRNAIGSWGPFNMRPKRGRAAVTSRYSFGLQCCARLVRDEEVGSERSLVYDDSQTFLVVYGIRRQALVYVYIYSIYIYTRICTILQGGCRKCL